MPGSLAEEPIDDDEDALCQLTACSISSGQNEMGAPHWPRMAVAASSSTWMVLSAIGLRSWSCGALVESCRSVSARNFLNSLLSEQGALPVRVDPLGSGARHRMALGVHGHRDGRVEVGPDALECLEGLGLELDEVHEHAPRDVAAAGRPASRTFT